MTPHLVLHHAPGACSQVCLVALEEAGLGHEVHLVDMKAGEQSTAAYGAVSPLGKVPALTVDGTTILENMAIQTYIAALRPEAGLFPEAATPMDHALRVSGLSYCGGTLHPIVRGLFNPGRLSDGDPEGVRSMARSLADKSFAYAERHLAASGWWLGAWSMVDVYLNWAVSIGRRADYNVSQFPLLSGLHGRLMERPAFARAMERDAEFAAEIERRHALA
jgi:glutathione S-transferase